MTALQTLRTVNANLATTQNRISTGYRVSTASDNAAYWSIATTMRSDNTRSGAVQDALGLGAATVDTMYTGLNGTVDIVSQIKAKLVAARTPGVDRGKIQTEITELQKQLKNTADSRGVQRRKLDLGRLAATAGYNATKSVVSSFSRAGGVVSDRHHRRRHRLDQAVRQDDRCDPAHQRGDWPDHRHLRGGCAATSP